MSETMHADLLDAVRLLDEAVGLFVRGETVVVAVSGGADSVALLDVLRRYAPERDLDLHVGHLDHMLRPESSDDAAFVSRMAHDLAVPCTMAARDVASLAAERGRGLEEAARTARYEFLTATAEQQSASALGVAHTADDQAETVLMNLLRGSGLRGLTGMSPVSRTPDGADDISSGEANWRTRSGPAEPREPYEPNEPVEPHEPNEPVEPHEPDEPVRPNEAHEPRVPPRLLRPLLNVTRADVMKYLSARDLPYRADESNRDQRFLRNRVRREIIPLLETVNPALIASLNRTARSAAADLALIEESVDRAWRERATVRVPSGGHARLEVELALDGWPEVHPAVQRRLLRRGVGVLRGRRDLGWGHVEALRELIAEGAEGNLLTLPGGLQAARHSDRLTLRFQTPGPPNRAATDERQLVIPGDTLLPGGWLIGSEVRDREPADSSRHGDIWTALLDADVAGAQPATRGRRPGDRLQPLGMGGHHKSLQDLFVDARIPRHERDSWPLVVSGQTVLWVPGVRLSHLARVTDATRRVLHLNARPPERVSGSAWCSL